MRTPEPRACPLLLALVLAPSLAAAAELDKPAPPPDAETSVEAATREGQFLPTTLPAAIGERRVTGLFLGGWDGGPLQGGTFSAQIEGQILRRVAIRVGIAYLNPLARVEPSVGVRVGVLTQAKSHLDLSIGAFYNNVGFTEASGEFEFSVAAAHRWNRVALVGNVLYGQGLVPDERDGEVRVAALVKVQRRVDVGLDARARVDLGGDSPGRVRDKLEADLDLLGGPLATVTLGHFALLAQVGAHSVLQNERFATGVAAFAGVGATY
jgi:hypothetical protein